jgi:hypothetical protein
METTEMLACDPAFDRLPLAKAQTRGCVLLRSPQARVTARSSASSPIPSTPTAWSG